MATFVLGYLLGSYEKKIPNWLLVLGAAVTLAVISVGTWLLTVRTGGIQSELPESELRV